MDTKAISKAASVAAGKTANGAVEVANKPVPPSVMVGNMLAKYKDDIAQALPSVMTPERFTRIAINAVSTSPKMVQAVQESPKSFIGALMTAAQLGVEPNTPLGQAYLLPYNNFDKNRGHKVMTVSFQLGYQGLIDLCYRSGEVTLIYAEKVCENDDFSYQLGLNPDIHHVPAMKNRGKAIYYYGVFKTKGGASGFKVMSYDDVMEHAKRFSKSYYNGEFTGPWASDFDSMAKKTVLLQALKYAPKKSDFAKVVISDNTTKTQLSKDMSEIESEDFVDGQVTPPPYEEGESNSDKARADKLALELGLTKGSALKKPVKGNDDDDIGEVE